MTTVEREIEREKRNIVDMPFIWNSILKAKRDWLDFYGNAYVFDSFFSVFFCCSMTSTMGKWTMAFDTYKTIRIIIHSFILYSSVNWGLILTEIPVSSAYSTVLWKISIWIAEIIIHSYRHSKVIVYYHYIFLVYCYRVRTIQVQILFGPKFCWNILLFLCV